MIKKLFILLFAIFMHLSPLFSQGVMELAKVIDPNAAVNDYLGYNVAISGDYAVVSSYNDDEDAGNVNYLADAGSAYILYRHQGGTDKWGIVKKICASDRAAGDYFGFTVAMDGDNIVICSILEDEDENGMNTLSNAGSVYLFSRNQGGTNNWGEVKKIKQPVRKAGDRFGITLAIKDSILVVTADLEDEDKNDMNTIADGGSAYVYYKNKGGVGNWGFVTKLVATDRAVNKKYGSRGLAIGNGFIVVGAPYEDRDVDGMNATSNTGAIYIYNKDLGGIDNWGGLKKITAPIRDAEDRFGFCVNVSGDDLFVTAPWDCHDENQASSLTSPGLVYLLGRNQGGTNNWGVVKKFSAPDRHANQYLGQAMSISDNYLVIATPWEDTDVNGNNSLSYCGGGYIYYKNQGGPGNWGFIKKYTHSDRALQDGFGVHVGISGNIIITGAQWKDEPAASPQDKAGAAYIHKIVWQAQDLSFSEISPSSMKISWEKGEGIKRCVFILKGNSGTPAPVNNTTYAADTVFGEGDQIGTSGWYCIYNGAGTSVIVTGLDVATTYRVMVCEYMGAAGSEQYITLAIPSNPVSQITDKYSQTITLGNFAATTWGDADIALTGNATSTLAVQYSSSDTNIASIVAGKIHLKGSGTCNIFASQPGNTLYHAAPQITKSFTVNKKDLIISAVSKTKIYGESMPVLGYSASGLASFDLISSVTITTVATETSDAGSYDIVPSDILFSTGKDSNYNITYTKGIFTINKVSQSIIFFPIPDKHTKDSAFNPGAYLLSGLPVSYASSEESIAKIIDSKIHIVSQGTVYITASQSGNNNYNAAPDVIQKLKITFPISNENSSYGILIYPNPATEYITIQLRNSSEGSFEIFNLLGVKLIQGIISSDQNIINISSLPTGTYYLNIITGKEKFTNQIIIL